MVELREALIGVPVGDADAVRRGNIHRPPATLHRISAVSRSAWLLVVG